jgi:hypothetical protein
MRAATEQLFESPFSANANGAAQDSLSFPPC